MRVDRLLGEQGIRRDTPEGRRSFEARMEQARAQEIDGARWAPVRRGWCLGTEEFRREWLGRIQGRLGEAHCGELRRETVEAKAEDIIAAELRRRKWSESDWAQRHKSDPGKLEVAARLRRETTLPVRWIAARLHLGTWKSATARLRDWK